MHKERPLSPHLQVYKFGLSMILSTLHRGFGALLTISTPALVIWLASIAAGPEAYAYLQTCFSHWLGQLVLLGWTVALFFHLCNGIRHLFWDVGRGYEIDEISRSGVIVAVSTLVLTVAAWWLAYQYLGSGGGA